MIYMVGDKMITYEESDNLSEAALETLAIIAYNQPVTRLMVDEIRGISSSQMIRKLVAKGFIKEGKNNKLRACDIKRIVDTVINQVYLDEEQLKKKWENKYTEYINKIRNFYFKYNLFFY